MKVLLVQVPSRRDSIDIPLGLCAVGAVLRESGHEFRITDAAIPDPSLASFGPGALDGDIEEFAPDVIGYGGIVTSAPRTLQVARYVRERSPETVQIAGGTLSSVGDLLLGDGCVDVVFHGEAEQSLPAALERVEGGAGLEGVPGISFRRNGEVVNGPAPAQVKDLDTLPLPAYDAIDMERYVCSARDRLGTFSHTFERYPAVKEHFMARTTGNERYIQMITKRGCSSACFFCYRHMKGLRSRSVGRVMEDMRMLTDRYRLGGFFIGDELFNHDRDWLMEFCRAFGKQFPDGFYIVGGARVDRMDKDMLAALRDSGCIEISYGQESGSATMLEEYRKGASVEQNRTVTRMTLEAGILAVAQLVLGGPSESPRTVRETVAFLEEAGVYTVSLNYLLPFPGSPSWTVVEERGLVSDLESYLADVAEAGGRAPVVNLTSYPTATVETWSGYVRYSVQARFHRAGGQRLAAIGCLLRRAFLRLPRWVRAAVRRVLRRG